MNFEIMVLLGGNHNPLLLCVTVEFKPDEITAIMNDFAEPGSLDPTSLHLGGTKYTVIQGEPAVVILGKKVILSHPFLTDQLPQHFTLPKWLMLMGPKFSNGEGRIQPQVSAMFSHTLQES